MDLITSLAAVVRVNGNYLTNHASKQQDLLQQVERQAAGHGITNPPHQAGEQQQQEQGNNGSVVEKRSAKDDDDQPGYQVRREERNGGMHAIRSES